MIKRGKNEVRSQRRRFDMVLGSNQRLYITGELLSEVLGCQSRKYNTTDFKLKYNTSGQVLTPSYLSRRTQLIYNMNKRVYSLRS